jgi:hypothetical protein
VQPELAGIAEGHFLEADFVVPGRAGDVQVAVDDREGAEAQVPVGGLLGAAPLGEHGIAQHPGGLADQRVMVDQDRRKGPVDGLEPLHGGLHALGAPGVTAGVRVGVQQPLVGAHHLGPVRLGERLGLRGRARRPERVVVEQEQRCYHGGAAHSLPDGVGILGGEHAEAAAQRHKLLVAFHAAVLDRVRRDRPQLVVARRPHDRAEPLAQLGQRPLDVRPPVPHVAGHQQPVPVGFRPQVLDELPVLRITDVQVADGQQFAGGDGHI